MGPELERVTGVPKTFSGTKTHDDLVGQSGIPPYAWNIWSLYK